MSRRSSGRRTIAITSLSSTLHTSNRAENATDGKQSATPRSKRHPTRIEGEPLCGSLGRTRTSMRNDLLSDGSGGKIRGGTGPKNAGPPLALYGMTSSETSATAGRRAWLNSMRFRRHPCTSSGMAISSAIRNAGPRYESRRQASGRTDAVGQRARQGLEQALAREGLGHHQVDRRRRRGVELVGPPREQHDRNRALPLELLGERQAGHPRHAEVGEHQIDGLVLEQLERLAAGGSREHRV